jgi:hypothetical protein
VSERRLLTRARQLSAVAGHGRFAQIAAIRADGVLPKLRRSPAFKAIDESEVTTLLQRHRDLRFVPHLGEPYILDTHKTINPLHAATKKSWPTFACLSRVHFGRSAPGFGCRLDGRGSAFRGRGGALFFTLHGKRTHDDDGARRDWSALI